MTDPWQSGNAYEIFMGRWSTQIARKFLEWLAIPLNCSWLDVGCGTGALTRLILEQYQPERVNAVDSSPDFITYAQQSQTNPLVSYKIGLAQSLDIDQKSIDAVVSGLMLNFVPEQELVLSEMIRVTKPGGIIGIFLWDYAEGMEMLRYFWDAAVQLNPGASELDEGIRFPLCRAGQLESLVHKSGMLQVEATSIEITTIIPTFEDYWEPFLGGVGPAPAYAMGINHREREMLKKKLSELLPKTEYGSISLMARAWAVKGVAV